MAQKCLSVDPALGRALSRRSFLGLMSTTALGVLAACAPKPSASAPAAEATEAPVEATQAPEAAAPAQTGKKQVIEMWMWETEPRWKEVQAGAGLDEKFPDVEFKWTALPYGDLHQKALTSMAAGLPEGLPSIIRTGANYYRLFVNAKGLVDTTEAVMAYKEDVMPFAWDNSIVEGKSYQVPDDTGVMLLGYRWDLFEKAGLPSEPDEVADMLKSYDDLLVAGEALDKAAGAKLFNMTPDAGLFNNLILQDSTGFFDAEGNVIFDSDYHVKVAEIAKKFWNSGLVSNIDQGPQYWQDVKDGKQATMFYPNWQDFVVIDNAPETKGKWRATKLPAVQTGGKRATTANGCQLCIPAVKPDEEKKLALEVALYMKFTVKATVAHMKTFSGAFVSYIPGLEAMAEEPSPVLDNQFVYKLYLETAQAENVLPWYRSSTAFFTDAEQATSNALFKILKDEAPIKDTLKEAADSIRQLQQSKGIK